MPEQRHQAGEDLCFHFRSQLPLVTLIEAPPPLTFRGQRGGTLKHPGEFLEEKQVTEANKCQNEFQGNCLRKQNGAA